MLHKDVVASGFMSNPTTSLICNNQIYLLYSSINKLFRYNVFKFTLGSILGGNKAKEVY